ncbi:hypothetical protein ACH5RR_023992 [Cinchona calisaya]|uniref:HTH myb-type domain-containing protein n=1 Tax=Cinchona calisaya TaxID=153742 RepID=A0ABD2ZFK0_9GENT
MIFIISIVVMSPDDTKIELKSQDGSFAAYFLKSLNMNEINKIWEFSSVIAIENNSVNVEYNEEGSADDQMASTSENINIEPTSTRENTPSNGDQLPKIRKKKGKNTTEKIEQGDDQASGDDELREKKHRIIWSDKLHKKFLQAMEMLHPEKPVPKRIVEVMNIPGLRREHVASHLQKYRILLKKAEDKSVGMNLTNNVGERPSIPSWHSSSNFNPLRRNPNVNLQLYANGKGPFNQGPLGIKSTASSTNLNPFSIDSRPSNSTTSMSNLRPSSNIVEGNINSRALMSQKSNYLSNYANSRGNDWRDHFLHMPQLKYDTNNVISSTGTGFRVYDDETKNMLLSFQSGSSSTTNADHATLTKSFLGIRLTNDGKSLEYGGKIGSGKNIEVRKEISSFINKTSGIENQGDHQDYQLQPPPVTTNNFKVSSAATNSQYQNDQGSGDNYYPSNSFSCISRLLSSMKNPSLPVDTPETQEAIQIPSAPANNNSISLLQQQQTFLPHLETPAYWDSSIQYEYSVQYPTTILSSILDDPPQINSTPPSAHQQQSNVPLLGTTSGIVASVFREPLTSTIQKNPQQESATPSVLLDEVLNSSWPDGNFSALMNETESSYPQLYWDGDFDTFFNQHD